jgi:hypothetical protein
VRGERIKGDRVKGGGKPFLEKKVFPRAPFPKNFKEKRKPLAGMLAGGLSVLCCYGEDEL